MAVSPCLLFLVSRPPPGGAVLSPCQGTLVWHIPPPPPCHQEPPPLLVPPLVSPAATPRPQRFLGQKTVEMGVLLGWAEWGRFGVRRSPQTVAPVPRVPHPQGAALGGGGLWVPPLLSPPPAPLSPASPQAVGSRGRDFAVSAPGGGRGTQSLPSLCVPGQWQRHVHGGAPTPPPQPPPATSPSPIGWDRRTRTEGQRDGHGAPRWWVLKEGEWPPAPCVPPPVTCLPEVTPPGSPPVSPGDATLGTPGVPKCPPPRVPPCPWRCPHSCPQCPLQVPPLGAPSLETPPPSPCGAPPGCPPSPAVPRPSPRPLPTGFGTGSPGRWWWRLGGGTHSTPPAPPSPLPTVRRGRCRSGGGCCAPPAAWPCSSPPPPPTSGCSTGHRAAPRPSGCGTSAWGGTAGPPPAPQVGGSSGAGRGGPQYVPGVPNVPVPAAFWDATRVLMLLAVLAAATGFALGLSAAAAGAARRARARAAGVTLLLAGTWGRGGDTGRGHRG